MGLWYIILGLKPHDLFNFQPHLILVTVDGTCSASRLSSPKGQFSPPARIISKVDALFAQLRSLIVIRPAIDSDHSAHHFFFAFVHTK